DRPAKHASRGSGAERHDYRRLDQDALEIEPPVAVFDLKGIRALMQAPLAAHLVLEMLDGVGHEGFAARDAGLLERPIEQPAGWPDKRVAGNVFPVSGLLADQHESRASTAFTRDDLRCVLIERAARALALSFTQLCERTNFRLIKIVVRDRHCHDGYKTK